LYRIKAKPNFNVILKDIGVSLKSENEKWIEVPKEVLDNSKDAKALADFYIKEDASAKKVVTKEEVKKVVEPKKETAFVAHKVTEEVPQGIFVAQPKGEEVEQISEVPEAKVLDKTEVIEVPAVEEKVEEKAPIVEEMVVAKEVKETKKATQKPTPKKATNKK
jgi:hypothetical protein